MHNPAKLEELRLIDPADLTSKQSKDLAALELAEPVFEQMLETLRANISVDKWQDDKEFIKHLKVVLKDLPDYRVKQTSEQTKTMLENIAKRLSVIDKTAPIKYNRKGEVILDPTTKDSEFVPLNENIEDYMAREVLPYVPDAEWKDEESDSSIKTGAEIPFTRYFYKYQKPESSDKLMEKFFKLEDELADIMGTLR